MSFACPHFDVAKDYCLRLDAECVPGRPGCVLRNNSVFYVPVEERLEQSQTPVHKHPAPVPDSNSDRG